MGLSAPNTGQFQGLICTQAKISHAHQAQSLQTRPQESQSRVFIPTPHRGVFQPRVKMSVSEADPSEDAFIYLFIYQDVCITGRGHRVVLVEGRSRGVGRAVCTGHSRPMTRCFTSHPLWPMVPPRVLPLVGIQNTTGSAPSGILQTS